MNGVVASTERREKASKGRSYQEFLIDSAAPNGAVSFAIDRDSSVGARRAMFASTAKELTLERTTVCIDDPSSFTQRAMVRTAAHLHISSHTFTCACYTLLLERRSRACRSLHLNT
jgi:hypothetical protein